MDNAVKATKYDDQNRITLACRAQDHLSPAQRELEVAARHERRFCDDPDRHFNGRSRRACHGIATGQQSGATWNELKVDRAPPNGTYDDQASSGNPGGPGGAV